MHTGYSYDRSLKVCPFNPEDIETLWVHSLGKNSSAELAFKPLSALATSESIGWILAKSKALWCLARGTNNTRKEVGMGKRQMDSVRLVDGTIELLCFKMWPRASLWAVSLCLRCLKSGQFYQ
jgi:hypothetical protein